MVLILGTEGLKDKFVSKHDLDLMRQPYYSNEYSNGPSV